MSKEEINYSEDVVIDHDALDLECLRQSELMKKYADYSSKARYNYDLAEEELEYVEAELDKEIREDPEAYDINKITETIVAKTINRQERYRKARKKLIDARWEYNNSRGAVKSIENKKSMLETLSKLHGQSYFAGPQVPYDLGRYPSWKEQQEEQEKNINKKVGKTIKKKSHNE